jgi:hypothetical protein
MPGFLSNSVDVMRNVNRTLLILPLLATLAAAPAFAADKPAKKESTLGSGKATGGYMTRDQLRSCLTRKDKMTVDDAELQKDEDAMTARKAEIVRNGDELKAKLDSLDRTNAEAVAGYNDAVLARDKQIEEFQSRATTFNARVDAKLATHADFAQSCGNRRYFEEDEIAIRNGR